MKRTLQRIGFVVGCIVLTAAVSWYISWNMSSHEAQVRVWASSHGYQVANLQRWHLGSPFWFWRRKGDDILQADLYRNGNTRRSYFRVSLWGVSQRWEDGSSEPDY